MMAPELRALYRAYSNLTNLVCVGTARTTVVKSGCQATVKYSMRLAFLQGKFLSLAYDKGMGRKRICQGLILRLGDGAARWTTCDECMDRVLPIKEALASVAGVTAGMSALVPALLVGAKKITSLNLLTRDQKLGGPSQRRYFLSGVVGPGCHRIVAVNRTSRLIESVVDNYSSADGNYTTRTSYRYL